MFIVLDIVLDFRLKSILDWNIVNLLILVVFIINFGYCSLMYYFMICIDW